jgi:hypothetical protein
MSEHIQIHENILMYLVDPVTCFVTTVYVRGVSRNNTEPRRSKGLERLESFMLGLIIGT